MKLTKSKLKQIIKEEISKILNEVDEPALTIHPGNFQVPDDVVTTRKEGYLQDVIDKYVDMVADTPDEMRQTLENIAMALKNKKPLYSGFRAQRAPGLSEFASNLLDKAVEDMKKVTG